MRWKQWFFNLAAVLFFSASGVSSLVAQPGRLPVSLDDLVGPHAVPVNGPWSLTLSASQEIDLTGTRQLPPNGVLHFAGAAVLTIHGGSLDLNGAAIDAPEDRRLFAGTGHVTGLAEARPEWFADAVDGVYPEGALRAAYAAARQDGTIRLRDAAYVSPFFDPGNPNRCGGHAVQIRPSLTIVGVKRPEPDSETDPTRLQGGSVLRGGICAAAVLHASHLGVDTGSFVMNHYFAGSWAFGIQLSNGGSLGLLSGSTLDDVSVLASGVTDQHAVIIEGQRNADVRNLWVWTPGGDHGLVMKSLSSTVTSLHCKGAKFDCLIFKSDYATDHAGRASDSKADGVFLHYLKTPGDTGGITLEGRWDTLRQIEISNVQEEGLSRGIAAADSALYSLEDVHIRDWTATDMRGACLYLVGGIRITVDGFHCSEHHLEAPWAFYLGGRETTLRNGTIACEGDSICGDRSTDGIVDAGSANRIEAVAGTGFGGSLVRTATRRGGTALEALDASGMGGRVAAPYVPPHVSLAIHAQAQWQETKLYLRILWTRVNTTLYLLGIPQGVAFGGVAVSFLLIVFFWRKRRR